jgi:predicted Zn finger-like uncharacterized protein
MIVACPGCSAKFRVADEKVGPRGARLRCSKCQTVFTVQHPVEEPPPPAPALQPRSGPPPLPRRTTLDARAAFEVDLEPHLGAAAGLADDPFAPPAAAGTGGVKLAPPPGGAPPADPFAAGAGLEFDAPAPPPPQRAATAFDDAFDPFAPPGPSPADALEGHGRAAPAAPDFRVGPGAGSLLSLEELTTPPARRLPVSMGPPPMAVLGATEDPFAGVAPLDAGLSELDDGPRSTAAPATGSRPVAALRPVTDSEPPLQLDPFGAAAVAADPLAVDEPRRVAAPQPAEQTGARRAEVPTFRFRDVLVSAMALAALLLLALAILVVWRGGLSPAEAFRPSAILAALAPRPPAGALSISGVTSGHYQREHGAPLLFVRGTVRSTSATPLEGVRVIVEVVRDGAVVASGEVPAGAVPGPEALHGAADAAALAKVLDEASRTSAPLAPGASAPFLVAFLTDPAGTSGAVLRVRPVAGGAAHP